MTKGSESDLVQFLIRWQGIGQSKAVDSRYRIEQLQAWPMSFSTLENQVLRSRLPGYDSLSLERIIQEQNIVWQGRQDSGQRDNVIALYFREHFPTLAPISIFTPGKRESGIRDLLVSQGPMSFDQMVSALGGYPNDILRSIWRMVWNGEISNESLSPLRTKSLSGLKRRRPYKQVRYVEPKRVLPGSSGKWFLLSTPDSGFAPDSERKLEQLKQLFLSMGFVCRESLATSPYSLGFDELRPQLEDFVKQGWVKKNRFMNNWSEPQYMSTQAHELYNTLERDQDVHLIAATDPANPYGALLSWPNVGKKGKLSRNAMSQVIFLGGELVGYWAKNTNALITIQDDDASYQAIVSALKSHSFTGPIFIRSVNGDPPVDNCLHNYLLATGFSASSKGYLLLS